MTARRKSWLQRGGAVLLVAAIFGEANAFAGTEWLAGPNENIVAGQLLVRFAAGASPGPVLQQIAPGATVKPVHPASNIQLVQLPQNTGQAVAATLASQPQVLYVEPNRIRTAQALVPNDPQLNAQWALQNIQAMQAWGVAPDSFLSSVVAGNGRIRVAVLDTGIDCMHPDFMNSTGGSTDSAAGGQINWALSEAFYRSSAPAPCVWADDFGHGTHVAGIIAAAANNGIGVAGVAYPVEILVYKILDANGSGDDGNIASAIVDAANSGASVISLSLGGAGYSQTLQSAVNYAWQKNALVVAAAGNNSNADLFFPGGANYAIGVAATDSNDALAYFSNYGPGIAVGAPGVGILSTVPTYANQEGATGYYQMSGTSMATPHVAGVGGMIFAASPNMSAAMARMLIEQAADNGNPGGQAGQQLGYGRINLWRAISGNLRSSSLGGIVGQVVDIWGNPAAPNPTISVAGQSVTVTNGTGLFRLYGIPPGIYTAVVSCPGYPAANYQVAVAAGADTNFTPVLGRTPAQFTGVVADNGQPVAGAVVEAISNGLVQSTAVTGPNGAYTLYVQPGSYGIQASALYRITASSSQSVSAYGSTTVNLNLPAMGTISGTVSLGSGAPAPGATVSVAGPRNTTATTDNNGHYSTIGLTPGGYTVTASAAGQSNVSATAGVSPDAVSVVNLAFSSGTTQPPPPAPSPSFTTIRVHSGGGALVDAAGNTWSADYGFIGGYTYWDSEPVGNTDTPALYQSQRWNNAPVVYQFTAPNGSYKVILKFAETWFTSAGMRTFNIVINGQQVASNFDIAAAAGGSNLAIDLTFPVNVTTGQITIQLTPLLSNPEINAIEIDAAGSSSTGGNPAVSAIRVHAGGSQYTDSLGQVWAADTGFTGGMISWTSATISGTSDQALYQTERWSPQSPIDYRFTTPNGSYSVKLKFSENWYSGLGQRLFNIAINGQPVETNFDIVAAAGGAFAAVDKIYPVNVTNGQLLIELTPVQAGAKIDALEIVRN